MTPWGEGLGKSGEGSGRGDSPCFIGFGPQCWINCAVCQVSKIRGGSKRPARVSGAALSKGVSWWPVPRSKCPAMDRWVINCCATVRNAFCQSIVLGCIWVSKLCIVLGLPIPDCYGGLALIQCFLKSAGASNSYPHDKCWSAISNCWPVIVSWAGCRSFAARWWWQECSLEKEMFFLSQGKHCHPQDRLGLCQGIW